MTIQRMDNVGIVVDDLDAAIAFFTELGTLLGFGFSSAAAVNDRGVIVGRSLSDTGLGHAVIWH